MLTLTRQAVDAIQRLLEAGASGGVRIHAGSRRFSRARSPSIQIEVAPLPDVDDTVLEVAGARIYLDPDTLRVLDDKVLDAAATGGEPRFTVYQRADRTRA